MSEVPLYTPRATPRPRLDTNHLLTLQVCRHESNSQNNYSSLDSGSCVKPRRLFLHGVTISEQLLYRNVQRLRGGLVFKVHRLLYHSTLDLRVIIKE